MEYTENNVRRTGVLKSRRLMLQTNVNERLYQQSDGVIIATRRERGGPRARTYEESLVDTEKMNVLMKDT